MTKIKITVDVNMTEERKAEIYAAFAAGTCTPQEFLSVPYTSIFKDFCPCVQYTWADIMHELFDIYFDKGSNALWNDLYGQAIRLAHKLKTRTSKVISDVINRYLRSIFSVSELRAFYKTKQNVETRIKKEYERHGRADMADVFAVSISGHDREEDIDLD